MPPEGEARSNKIGREGVYKTPTPSQSKQLACRHEGRRIYQYATVSFDSCIMYYSCSVLNIFFSGFSNEYMFIILLNYRFSGICGPAKNTVLALIDMYFMWCSCYLHLEYLGFQDSRKKQGPGL